MIANGRIISVNYYPGAGGNFVQNCLGLSRYCVLRDQDYVKWQLNATVDSSFYQQKLSWVLATVPHTIDHNWINYELGSHRMIGFRLDDHHGPQHIPEPIHHAAQQGLWITYGTHSHVHTRHFTRLWPDVKYINVLAPEWARQWQKIKKNRSIFNNKETHSIPKSYSAWESSPDAYTFDFDTAIESQSIWLDNMHLLYKWLEWEDFDQVPIAEYYRVYKLAHDQQQNL
jgi:hypothetical protein